MNIVGTTWLKVTRCCSTSARYCSGSKCSITIDGAAEPVRRLGRSAAARRGTAARGRGRRSDSSAPKEQLARPVTPSAPSPSGASGQRHLHALGPTGGAGAVEHVLALDALLVERGGRLGGDDVLVGLVAVDGAVEHSRTFTAGIWSRELGGLVGLVGRGDEGLRAAVVEDVRHLLGGEPRAHGGVVEAGVVAAPDHREEARRVLEAERDVVARLEAGRRAARATAGSPPRRAGGR